MGLLGMMALEAIPGLISGLFGSGQQKKQYGYQRKLNQQQMQLQKQLNTQQFGHQQQLNVQGQELGMQTWKQTSYPAQMEMMKQAGLNPGLMYGMGGGGGSTVGSPSGGQASAGNAQGGSAPPMLDIAQLAMMGTDMKVKRAQAKELEELANLHKTEAGKIAGVDTEKAKQEIQNMKSQIEEINSRIEVNNGIIALNMSQEDVNKTAADLNIKRSETETFIQLVNTALAGMYDAQASKAMEESDILNLNEKWMLENGLNPADSGVKKTLTYISQVTGMKEKTIVYLLGGAVAFERLAKIIAPFINPTKAGTVIKGLAPGK